jgi:DNA modification methylase
VHIFDYDSFGTFDKNFCDMIILSLTNENDLVLDPFAGTGIALQSAERLNRKTIGCTL